MRGSLDDQPEVAHHEQAAAQGGDIPQVAAGDDDHVRDLPVELLDDLDADGLLSLDAQRVHGIGQVDRLVLGDLLHNAHAAVKVRVQRQHQRAVGDRLDELRNRDLALGQQARWTGCRQRRSKPPGPPRCRRWRRRPRPGSARLR